MMGPTHMAAGILAGYALTNTDTPQIQLLTCAVAAIGSLLPDIDLATSKISKVCRPAALAIQLLFGHRGVFHSPLLWAALTGLGYAAFPQYASLILAAACGIGTHLLLDMLNAKGIPLLWPITKHISLAKFRTYGLTDFLLFGILTATNLRLLFPAILSFIGR